MKPLHIITAADTAGQIPIVFPDHTGIPAFTLPKLSLVDRDTVNAVDDWMDKENAARTKAGTTKVTNYEMCEQMFRRIIDDATADKVLARPIGEVLQIWDAWMAAGIHDTTTEDGDQLGK